MPLSSAATSTAFTNATTRNVKGGQVVQLNLRMNGVSFVPADLFTALETLYGSGKVTATTDAVGQGVFNVQIDP
jgi:hypothetical protein